jgi:hypothetical protein
MRVKKIIAYDTSTDFNVYLLTRAGVPHMGSVNQKLRDMSLMRGRILKAVGDIQERWQRFASKNPEAAILLNDLQIYNTLAQISPTINPTIVDGINNDAKLNTLKEELAKAASPQSAASYKGKITSRLNEIKNSYEKWDKLDAEGKQIYAQTKEFYKAMFALRRTILDDQIAKSSVPGDINDASTPKGKLVKAARISLEESNFLAEYFPLMRPGNHWVSFGKNSTREVHRFDSDVQAEEFRARRIKELQAEGDARTWEERVADGEAKQGEDVEGLRQSVSEASSIMRKTLEIIDSNAKADKAELKDAIYQLFLESVPERSFRKSAIHRKEVAGFNTDMRRNFVTAGYTYANQLSRLKYGAEIQLALSSAKASLEGNPLGFKVSPFMHAVERRIGEALNPANESNPFLNAVYKVAQLGFAYTLSAPVSWIMNVVSVPTFAYWTLARYYGTGNAAAALTRYAHVTKNLSMHKVDASGKKVFVPITVAESPRLKKNPLLKEAFKQLVASEITEQTGAFELLELSRKPSTEYLADINHLGASIGGLRRGMRNGLKALGYGFHHSERIIREAVVMADFELGYAKNVSKGMTPGINGDAFNKAIQDAINHTKTSLFNYETVNRPQIMRTTGALSIAAPLASQFKMYTSQAVEFSVKSFLDMMSKTASKEEQFGAAIQFFGSMLTVLFMGGLSGFYEFDDMLNLIQKILNDFTGHKHAPITTRDIKFWYRNELLPNLFGDKWAQILDKGPISAISNIDISTRSSMDFGLFHDGGASTTLADDIQDVLKMIGGAGLGMSTNMVRGAGDISQGHYYEGLEKILPKLLSNPVAATRWSQEGIKDEYTGKTLIDKKDISRADIVWKAIGFNRTDLDMIKDRAFRLKGIEAQIDNERTSILQSLDLEARKGDMQGFRKVLKDVNAFNKANPLSTKVIWPDTIITSLESHAEDRAYAKNGIQLNNELHQIIYKTLTHIPIVQSKRE